MTVAPPTPDEPVDPIVEEALEIIRGEAEAINVETVFMYAAKVGVMLLAWRKMMESEGAGFSKRWIEEASMTLFEKFFNPFVPNYGDDRHDGDGDD